MDEESLVFPVQVEVVLELKIVPDGWRAVLFDGEPVQCGCYCAEYAQNGDC